MGQRLVGRVTNKRDGKRYVVSTAKAWFGSNWETGVCEEGSFTQRLVRLHTRSPEAAQYAHTRVCQIIQEFPLDGDAALLTQKVLRGVPDEAGVAELGARFARAVQDLGSVKFCSARPAPRPCRLRQASDS